MLGAVAPFEAGSYDTADLVWTVFAAGDYQYVSDSGCAFRLRYSPNLRYRGLGFGVVWAPVPSDPLGSGAQNSEGGIRAERARCRDWSRVAQSSPHRGRNPCRTSGHPISWGLGPFEPQTRVYRPGT